ncbi:MAG: 30S ribosomal protein S1 [Desulfovibrionaceae bacterium]|nr:30S ribosomal protein S1 [Desulfovibrionaceae bacterium]MBF0514286.1 30S ribosomal protein S1 [Desulfovibrionaceae bacterium]
MPQEGGQGAWAMTDGQEERPIGGGGDDREEQSFADLFAASIEEKAPPVKVGAKIKGRIIGIGEESVFIDAGVKIDGVAVKKELLDESGNFPYAEGDVIELYVVDMAKDEIKLSRAFSGSGGLEGLYDAKESGLPVNGRIAAVVKGGVSVEIMRQRAFCPVSQLDLNYVSDPAALVGQEFQFLITKVEERGRNIVVSRRKLLEIEREKALAELLETLKVGDVISATVTRLAPFGAFARIATGVDGLIHISELSWRRVADPAEAVSLGQELPVKVTAIEKNEKNGQLKISLSAKQAGADPWSTAAESFKAGDTVPGKVARLADFGAFIEIAPGIEGLAHVSELSHVKRVLKASDVLALGEEVMVVVKEVDPAKRRISLSLKAASADPWRETAASLTVGTEVEGVLEKRADFGLFVNLFPGVTGLMPKSKMAEATGAKSLDNLKPGARLTVVIAEINPAERKITLAPAGTSADTGDWRGFAAKGDTGAGTMSGLLQAALDNKDNKDNKDKKGKKKGD